MSASIASLTAILKEFYLGPIAEQLNQEILVYELFDKASVDWSGRRVVIPVHVARNTGVAFVADDGTLPTAGQQDFERLEIDAKFLYGRFAITGPAIASAKSGPNAFISYVDAEMNKLVEDVKTAANQRAIFGGRVLGYIMDTIAANEADLRRIVLSSHRAWLSEDLAWLGRKSGRPQSHGARRDYQTLVAAGRYPRAGGEARIVVFGDAELASNRYLRALYNLDLVLNAVHWAADQEPEITQRPKIRQTVQFPVPLDNSVRALYGVGLLLPELLLIAGGIVWLRRRSA